MNTRATFGTDNDDFCGKCPLYIGDADATSASDRKKGCTKLCLKLPHIKLRPKQLIHAPENTGRALYIIRKGSLKTQMLLPDGRRQVLSFRFPGDLHCSAMMQQMSDSSVEALCDTWLLEVPQDIFHPSYGTGKNTDQPMWQVLLTLVGVQMERLTLHNLMLGRLTAKERIISFLLELALRTGRHMTDRIEFFLPMSRDDIADYLGLNELTVIRTLTSLKKTSALEMPNPGQAYVANLEALAKQTPIGNVLLSRLERAFPSMLPNWAKDQAVPSAGSCPFSGHPVE